MKVVALFRVSTEKQETEGSSLDAQQGAYRAMAKREGWTTVDEFKGTESATQAATERRVLQQVLDCVRANEVDAIWVIEQSRLTRGDELEVALLFRELKERKLRIIVNGVVRDLGSIDERFMVGIQSLVDRAESERIKERMMRGKKERARQGKRSCGAPPLGYTNPPKPDPRHGTLQVVPEEAVVVRRVFELAAKGMGAKRIAVTLNEQGMRASRGRWASSSVTRTLINPVYTGVAASNVWVAKPGTRTFRFDPTNAKAVLIPNAHPPIVDQATWDAVHNRTKLPRTVVPRMLTGYVFVDGRPYKGDSSRNGTFYRPARGERRGLPWLDAPATDAAVWSAFASLATGPEFVQRIMAEASNPREQLVIAQEIEYLEGRIEKLRKRLDRFIEMRADGEIDKATFAAKTAEEQKAIDAAQVELAALRSRIVVADSTVAARVAGAVRVLLAGGTRLTTAQKRSLLASIVRRVDVDVEPTGALQKRGAKGYLAGSGGPRWAVRKVAFRLALPPADAARANVAADGGDDAALEAVGAGGSRDWQLGTTSLCSGPRARARR